MRGVLPAPRNPNFQLLYYSMLHTKFAKNRKHCNVIGYASKALP